MAPFPSPFPKMYLSRLSLHTILSLLYPVSPYSGLREVTTFQIICHEIFYSKYNN